MATERTAQQPPAAAAPPRCLGQVLPQGLRSGQGAEPEQATQPPAIQHQMHGQLQLQHQVRHPLQGEQVGAVVFRVAPVAEAIELAMLSRAQAPGPAAEMGLLQRFSSQAPAERSPRDSPGIRVR